MCMSENFEVSPKFDCSTGLSYVIKDCFVCIFMHFVILDNSPFLQGYFIYYIALSSRHGLQKSDPIHEYLHQDARSMRGS